MYFLVGKVKINIIHPRIAVIYRVISFDFIEIIPSIIIMYYKAYN